MTDKILLSSDNKAYGLIKSEIYTANVIPNMTSDTTPSGVVSASNIRDSNFPAWKAFDGKKTADDRWVTANNVPSAWIQYQFPDKKKIGKYSIFVTNSADRFRPKNWTFEGSNDGSSWIVLDTQINQTDDLWTANSNSYSFNNNDYFLYYRLNVTATSGAIYFEIQEIEMYERIHVNKILISSDNKTYSLDSVDTWYEIPSASQGNFINYGQQPLSNLDLLLTNKKYILQTAVSENSDGLWKTQLNRKPLSIKFE